jgi:geranylgeranyl pyrophosphate synthase
MSTGTTDEQKVAGVLEVYNELNISEVTKTAMQAYFEEAMLALDKIEATSEFKQPLVELAEMLMMRKK